MSVTTVFGTDASERISAAFVQPGTYAVYGREGADTINGLGASQPLLLFGEGWNDLLFGGSGTDSLDGGAGVDTMWGGAGADTFIGSAEGDWVTYDERRITHDPRPGAGVTAYLAPGVGGAVNSGRNAAGDVFVGITGLTGSLGDDVLGAGLVASHLEGGIGNDTLISGPGADRLDGGSAYVSWTLFAPEGSANHFEYGLDDAFLIRGDNFYIHHHVDIVSYQGSDPGIVVSRADPSRNTGAAAGDVLLQIEGIIGTEGGDTLYGAAGEDTLRSNDQLHGAGGDDLILPGHFLPMVEAYREPPPNEWLTVYWTRNRQIVDGGAGDDTVSYEDMLLPVHVELAEEAGPDDEIFESIEHITGGAGADTLVGTDDGNRLDGRGGDDELYGWYFGSPYPDGGDTLTGGAGADSLFGVSGNDLLLGGLDNDSLHGGMGNDVLDGGAGADTLDGGGGADTIIAAAGDRVANLAIGRSTLRVDGLGAFIDLRIGQATTGSGGLLFSGIVDIAGTEGNDQIIGQTDAAQLAGMSPDNRLDGAGGDDWMLGGLGADTLVGGEGFDTASYQADGAGVLVDLRSFIAAFGMATGDFVTVSVEALDGGSGNDSLGGSEGANRLRGGFGSDYMAGYGDADTMEGEFGADSMEGGLGADRLLGGNADDRLGDNEQVVLLSFADDLAADSLYGEAGNDTLLAAGGNDLLVGSIGADLLEGGANDDTLFDGIEPLPAPGGLPAAQAYAPTDADTLLGGAGDDVLHAGGGGDSLDGGTGNDRLAMDFTGEAGAIAFTLAEAGTWAVTLGGAVTAAVTGVERLSVTGGEGQDRLLAGRATGASTLDGGGGNDSLLGGRGADLLAGGAGRDSLNGGSGRDTLRGGEGDDSYWVGQSGDVVVELPGEGVDRVVAAITWTLGAEIETLTLSGRAAIHGTGNALANQIAGNVAANLLSGGAGDDSLRGGDGDDSLAGGTERDTLEGGAGADSLAGGAGDDLYILGDAADTLVEQAAGGLDRVLASVSWTLAAEFEQLTLAGAAPLDAGGNAGANLLTGNEAANRLDGADGHDTLFGAGGADTLVGGLGRDSLDGGSGEDLFVFLAAAEGGDVIRRFAGGEDRIAISAAGFGTGLEDGMDPALDGRFVESGSGQGTIAGLGQLVWQAAERSLWWDADGAEGGRAVLLARLPGFDGLGADDLRIVA